MNSKQFTRVLQKVLSLGLDYFSTTFYQTYLYFYYKPSKFVCVEVYGPVNPMGSCPVWSVYLTTCLLDRLNPLSG